LRLNEIVVAEDEKKNRKSVFRSIILKQLNIRIMNLPIQAKPVNRQNTAIETSRDGIYPSACVNATISGGMRICATVPKFGVVCINSPVFLAPGAKAKACACKGLTGVTGVNFKVKVGRSIILTQTVGRC
jgi:hypothetical protein